MRSMSSLLVTSTQLVLHLDMAFSLPILPKVDIGDKLHSTSRAYPSFIRDSYGLGGQIMDKRSLTEASQQASHSNAMTSPSMEKAGKVLPKAISLPKYHAKSIGINFRKAGSELLHGPIRGIAELPVSGVIGAGRHAKASYQYAAAGDLKRAGLHFASAPAKLIAGVTVAPAYAFGSGAVHALKPIARATGHFGYMTKTGVQQGIKSIRGKGVSNHEDGHELLEDARQRPVKAKETMDDIGIRLRGNSWRHKSSNPIQKSSTFP